MTGCPPELKFRLHITASDQLDGDPPELKFRLHIGHRDRLHIGYRGRLHIEASG